MRRSRAPRRSESWLAAVEKDGHATRARARLGAEERLCELVMMGLRLSEGISRTSFRRVLDAELEDLLDPARLESLTNAGYLELDPAGLRATASGRQRLNAVTGYLLADAKAAAVS